jgi:hypothetical protein
VRDRIDANRDGWDYCTQWACTYERLGNPQAAQEMRSARWLLNPYGPYGRDRER